MSGQMIVITPIATGRPEHIDPDMVARIEPGYSFDADGNRHADPGACLTLWDNDDTVINVLQSPEDMVARINTARARPTGVRVTNWMGQIWVLLVSSALLDFVLTRFVRHFGDEVFAQIYASHPTWWLP